MADSTASFEADAIGAAPKGWTATKTGKGDPKWTIEQDKTAPSNSKLVKQSGRATYPLLLKDDTDIKDGFIQMKFKAVAGSEDRAGGVVWRARDANNYYVARANALEDNVVLYKTVAGVRRAHLTSLAGREATGSRFRSQPMHGLRCAWSSKATAFASSTTADSCSRSKTRLSQMRERSDCGQRPTV